MTVAAIAVVLGKSAALRRRVEFELTNMTREGLSAEAIASLAEDLSIERTTLARVVGTSDRKFSVRLASGSRLSADESKRVARIARVVAKSVDTFGTLEKASHWLNGSNRALGGQVPLDLLRADEGAQEVETILGRIDYGLYS